MPTRSDRPFSGIRRSTGIGRNEDVDTLFDRASSDVSGKTVAGRRSRMVLQAKGHLDRKKTTAQEQLKQRKSAPSFDDFQPIPMPRYPSGQSEGMTPSAESGLRDFLQQPEQSPPVGASLTSPNFDSLTSHRFNPVSEELSPAFRLDRRKNQFA